MSVILGQQEKVGVGLDQYLGSIAKRMRAAVVCRGFGALAATALVVTAVCVFLANRAAFSPASISGARAFLFLALGTVATALLVLPLRRLMRGRTALLAADEAERQAAAFSGRLRTWADERERAANLGREPTPLLGLLGKDAEQAAAAIPPDMIVGRAATAAFGIAGCCLALGLLWLGTSGPGYWQYGTSKLWAGWFLAQDEPLYELRVEPGDTTIRKGGQLDVTATSVGFDPSSMLIYAKFESSPDWERAPMGPQLEGSGFRFSFSMVREPLRYYVEAGRMRSREFSVGVVAMPTVESIRIEYEYPAWSGLEPRVEDPGGDVLAVPETDVTVILTTDKPVADGLLVIGGKELPLRGNQARFAVQENTTYHVAAIYRDERVRLTEDYFVTAIPDKKPEIKILEPGRDWRASSIEEVRVRVATSDDFGLRSVRLHYAVNGANQTPVDLPSPRNAKQSESSHVFYLEEFGEAGAPPELPRPGTLDGLPPPAPEAGLLPGDLISYYIVAADAKREVRSDMYFINVQPFERRFSQSQQAGGQGGQGQQQDEISRRQKEIVIATWNLINERDSEDGRETAKLRESAEMLSQLQGTLMQQAQTLVQRTRARQLTGTDPKFEQFAKFMEQAAESMEPAAEALQGFRLDDAVGPEQEALQFLLRAENLFTDIQVTMGRGGGGGGGASQDLAEMFELEMDLEKNQYETGGRCLRAAGRAADRRGDTQARRTGATPRATGRAHPGRLAGQLRTALAARDAAARGGRPQARARAVAAGPARAAGAVRTRGQPRFAEPRRRTRPDRFRTAAATGDPATGSRGARNGARGPRRRQASVSRQRTERTAEGRGSLGAAETAGQPSGPGPNGEPSGGDSRRARSHGRRTAGVATNRPGGAQGARRPADRATADRHDP